MKAQNLSGIFIKSKRRGTNNLASLKIDNAVAMLRIGQCMNSTSPLCLPSKSMVIFLSQITLCGKRLENMNRPFTLRGHVTSFYENESCVFFSSKND